MVTVVRDLDGQRSIEIDARSNTVFLDAEGFCYEIDRGILLRALAKEALFTQACMSCALNELRVA